MEAVKMRLSLSPSLSPATGAGEIHPPPSSPLSHPSPPSHQHQPPLHRRPLSSRLQMHRDTQQPPGLTRGPRLPSDPQLSSPTSLLQVLRHGPPQGCPPLLSTQTPRPCSSRPGPRWPTDIPQCCGQNDDINPERRFSQHWPKAEIKEEKEPRRRGEGILARRGK